MDLLWACELESLRAYCDRVLIAGPDTEKAAALYFESREVKRQILAVEGDTAILDVRGTLTNRPSPIASFLGFATTSYIDIQEAIDSIAGDDSIKNVRLIIDSPGGNVTGLDETWLAIRELAKKKNVVAENHGLMASAAYWLATAADKIVATSPAAETGSIGVYLLAIDYSKQEEKYGIKEIRIVSKNAPLKNPSPATKEGLRAYQDRLDALERVFISRVAEGRGVTVEKVEKDFGRGALLVAEDPDSSKPDALSVGMIDEVQGAVMARCNGDRRRSESEQTEMFAGSPPFKDLSVVDRPWDSAAAIKRVRTKTGSTEKPASGYKAAFFWYDSAKEEDFGGYKLPFVDVVDGKLVAVRKGVFAAKGAMAGARGNKPAIPASDVAAVNSHIDKYVKKIEKEDKEKKQGKSAAAGTNRKDHPGMKYTDLQAGDPELFEEIQGLLTAAKNEGKEEGKSEAKEAHSAAVKIAEPVLTGDSLAYIKKLAVQVLQGEATEKELEAARAGYDAAAEALKGQQAQTETVDQGGTHSENSQVTPTENGEIKSEDDHNSEVARFRNLRGQEAN